MLEKYNETDWLLYRKAKTLLILNLIIILIIALELIITSIILNRVVPESFPNSSIIIILIVAVYVLKQGKYELATALSIISVIGGITWTRFDITGQFSADVSYDFTQYVLDLVVVIIYTYLIAKSKFVIAVVILLILLLLGIYAYIIPLYDGITIHPYMKSVILSGFGLLIIAGLIGWFNFQQNETAIETAIRGENRYHSLFENAQDAIFIIRSDRFIECNPKTLQMFGCKKEQIIGKTPYYFAPRRQHDGIESEKKAHQLIELALSGIPQRFEWQHTRLDGSLFDAEVSLNRLEFYDEVVLLAIVRDVSERKQLEKEVYMSYIKGEENERTRIAKDIHDGLGPLLSTCKIYHYNLGIYPFNQTDRMAYDKLGMLLKESMVSIKEISNNLSPHILRNFGLIEAIRNFVGNLQTDIGFDIDCACDTSKRYDELTEVSLYRVVIELIHNSLKHSGASKINIRIEENNNGALLVRYKDNGIGFNYDEAIRKSNGFGLLNLQSRIHTLGGEIAFKTRKNEGVDVNIAINL